MGMSSRWSRASLIGRFDNAFLRSSIGQGAAARPRFTTVRARARSFNCTAGLRSLVLIAVRAALTFDQVPARLQESLARRDRGGRRLISIGLAAIKARHARDNPPHPNHVASRDSC
jgi:hypothetical protein